ncbi:MAG: sigma-70 family RNA polymerase sigma factor [Candidatus Moranbacteria bacterium]|nr:sigma-70 family RNA polymerase sigma factor [Candidatus Moranbacteria bacterium]
MNFQIDELEIELLLDVVGKSEDGPSDEELESIEGENEFLTEVILTEESGSDIARKYLNEIGAWPILTREEEIDLAQKIENGDRDAFEKFVNSNLKLVVKWAKRYCENYHLKFLDCVQEGNFGLMKGVEKFDWRRGFKFSTYGSWWIKQAIQRAIKDNDRTIRLPVHISEMLSKIWKARRELVLSLGCNPSTLQIAEHMGVPEQLVVKLFRKMCDTKSLQDQLSSDDDGTELGDLLEDKNGCCPEETAQIVQLGDKLRQSIDSLPEEQRQVVIFKCIENLPNTIIAERLGVKPGKVNEVWIRARKKLIVSKDLRKLLSEFCK